MTKFDKKLDELEDLLKQFNASIKTPKANMPKPKGQAPVLPGVTPQSHKDPKKVAQQLNNAKKMKNPLKPKLSSPEKLNFSTGGQWSLKKSDETTQKLSPEQVKASDDSANVIQSTDAIPGRFNAKPEQQKLISGLDFRSGNVHPLEPTATSGKKWLTSHNHDDLVMVKPSGGFASYTDRMARQHDKLSAAKRETLFHNMAHDFFDMGKHVPTTASFNKNLDDYSAQKKVDAHHGKITNDTKDLNKLNVSDKYEKSLKKLHADGTIHKMALMDSIMANHDRHRNNFMIDNKKNHIHLIDNGTAFDYINFDPRHIPAYVSDGESVLGLKNDEIHPAAKKWINSLSPDEASKILEEHGIDKNSDTHQGFLKRLESVKNSIKNNKSLAETLKDSRYSTGLDYEHAKLKGAG
jgi:hypothetical protein